MALGKQALQKGPNYWKNNPRHLKRREKIVSLQQLKSSCIFKQGPQTVKPRRGYSQTLGQILGTTQGRTIIKKIPSLIYL